jgi:hypothetical protein
MEGRSWAAILTLARHSDSRFTIQRAKGERHTLKGEDQTPGAAKMRTARFLGTRLLVARHKSGSLKHWAR